MIERENLGYQGHRALHTARDAGCKSASAKLPGFQFFFLTSWKFLPLAAPVVGISTVGLPMGCATTCKLHESGEGRDSGRCASARPRFHGMGI